MALLMVGITMVMNIRSSPAVAAGGAMRDLITVMLAAVSVLGPELILTWRAFSDDYDMLGLIRLSVDMRKYVLSKFVLPFTGGATVTTLVTPVLDWYLGTGWWLPAIVGYVTSVVVAAFGLGVASARLYLGANPKRQDPVSGLVTAGFIYLYVMSLILPLLLVESPTAVLRVVPFWLVLSMGSLILSARWLSTQEIKH